MAERFRLGWQLLRSSADTAEAQVTYPVLLLRRQLERQEALARLPYPQETGERLALMLGQCMISLGPAG